MFVYDNLEGRFGLDFSEKLKVVDSLKIGPWGMISLLATNCMDWNVGMSNDGPLDFQSGSCCVLDTVGQVRNVETGLSKILKCQGIVP